MTSEYTYTAYDAEGHSVGIYGNEADALEAAARANALRQLDDAQNAHDNAVLRVRVTAEDRALVASLSPGMHLSILHSSQRRTRRVAFRSFSALPYVVVNLAILVVALPVTIAAWISLVSTGHYPKVLFSYNRGLVRFSVRLYAYGLFLTDIRPPLTGGMVPAYPVRIEVIPQDSYDRLKAAFRLFLLIPLAVLSLLGGAIGVVTVLFSYPIVMLTGHQIAPLRALGGLATRINATWLCAALLLTEDVWLSANRD